MSAVQSDRPQTAADATLNDVVRAANSIILGKDGVIRLALACMLARGHLLIEDLPGVGKTTLAHVLARALGLSFQRIQFTSDMLPADILGSAVYSRETGAFSFHPGPVFTQLILADEVNRATPRTQSALLEAMEERQVTVEGETRPLPDPFFVIATQNPSHQVGTFPLPESQLDRFMMCVHLGYPDSAAERELLRGRDRRELLAELQPIMNGAKLHAQQAEVDTVVVSDALLDYLQDLLEFSRVAPDFSGGLSPRAGLAIRRAAQAWALLHGRRFVLPEDVQAVAPSVIGHRLVLTQELDATAQRDAAERLLQQVPIP